MSFNWTPTKVCKELYLDYFYDYADIAIDNMSEKNKRIIILENTKDTLSSINNVIKDIKNGKKYVLDEPAKELQKLYILRSQLNSIQNQINIAAANTNQGARLSKLADDWLEVTQKINQYGIVSKFSVKVTDFADKYQHLMNKKNFTGLSNQKTISVATTIFSTGINVFDTIETYAKLKANNAAYAENLDILAYMQENGNRPYTRKAASEIFEMVSNNMDSFIAQTGIAIAEDVIMGGTKYAVAALMTKNPYTAAIKAAYDAFDLLIGASHKAKCVDTALSLESLTTAVSDLTTGKLTQTPMTYDCINDEHSVSDRYLTHLAQLRIVGEDNFIDYSQNTGWISKFFTSGYNEAKAWCDTVIKSVWEYAGNLKLKLSEKLPGYSAES